MEVQTKGNADNKSVMGSTATQGSVTVALHPLVIMNISDHYTRIKAQEAAQNPQVIGALLGVQEGRKVEIFNSFELQYDYVDQDIIINMDYYRTKEEQFRQVFKTLDFLGWYTTGEAPTEKDRKIHRQLCEINESPLFLKLNPLLRNNDLPISLFESVIDLVDGEACMLFVEIPYTLATEEAERIGVDHVARVSVSGNSDASAVSDHLIAQFNSIKMLYSRVSVILEYTKAVQRGELQCNHEIMRSIRSLCQRLPVIKTDQFKGDFYNQCNDVMLMTYLATITKGCHSMNEFINKFNVVFDRHGMVRRMRGLFF